jgi:hypothetical protein
VSDVRNPQQFFHGSDHEFNPGDEVLPGNELEESNFATLHPGNVYMTNSWRGARDWGKHSYEVEPVGEPTSIGFGSGRRAQGGYETHFVAPKAKVIRKVGKT